MSDYTRHIRVESCNECPFVRKHLNGLGIGFWSCSVSSSVSFDLIGRFGREEKVPVTNVKDTCPLKLEAIEVSLK